LQRIAASLLQPRGVHWLTYRSDRHIDSLSQLTGESSTAIRHWFGQALKQGMTYDSAYKSQTGFTQPLDPILYTGSSGPTETASQPLFPELLDVQATATTTTTTTIQGPLRGGRKGCNPTDDPELLKRDPNKIYQCTRKCGKRYGRKCDWKRNEEEGYPSKSWICALCVGQGDVRVKPCFRKYHFSQHFRNIHPGLNCADYEQASIVESDTEFPKKCGFCTHRFTERQDRIDHIAEHFKQGKCMLDWIDDDDEHSGDSDSTDDNDDDNDRPDSGGFGNNKPFYSPNQDQCGGSGSKHNGSSGSGSGAQQPPQGGYFQFHLTQSAETEATGALRVDGHIESNSKSSSPDEQHVPGRLATTAGTHSHALAADAVTQSLDELLPDGAVALDHSRDSSIKRVNTVKLTQVGRMPTSIAPDPPIEVDLAPENQAVPSPLNAIDPLRRSVSPLDSQSFLSVKLLGTGGFSTVDEVVHRETSLRVSRKTLKNRDHSALAELKKEVDVLQKLRHPHVIRFLGAYSNGDKMSLLLSPVAETTLAAWLDKSTLERPSGLAQTIVSMLGCLSSTVRYLHEQRPVVKHMDIKPQNILVMQGDQEFPHVVLSDFGVSSFEETNSDGKSKPLTRQYCAPEVSEGISREQAADIWSLGCVFAEMSTVAFSEGNSNWLEFRREFRGREGKYYWQDVHALHDWLSQFLDEAKDLTEATVVRTVKSMLNPEPTLRPDAAKLTMTFTPAPCCLGWPNEKVSYPGPLEESASVEMFIQQDGVDCHARFHLHGEADGKQPCDSVAHAKLWLAECSHDHEACRQQLNSAKALPTRLVDIRPDNVADGSVRIVDSAQLDSECGSIDYVSLGYSWGQEEPVLATNRLKAMQSELSRDLLPRALNEAISAAERMGYRYIWVDSLCVLQDSEEDKERECLATADVYRNSALTIVLDQLQRSMYREGTIPKDRSRKEDGTNDPCRTPSGTNSLLIDHAAIDFQTPGFGWDTRAWALQERFLSPRHLHLGEQQMYWECNALKASETFPRGLPPLLWEKVHTKTTTPANAQPLQCSNRHMSSAYVDSGSTDGIFKKPAIPNSCLRNQQRIRKEGGEAGIGDPMEAPLVLELCVGTDNVKSKIQDTDCDFNGTVDASLQSSTSGDRIHTAPNATYNHPTQGLLYGNQLRVGEYCGNGINADRKANGYCSGDMSRNRVDERENTAATVAMSRSSPDGMLDMNGLNAGMHGDGEAGVMDLSFFQ
jgi:serine/threonine protein kinase